MSGVTPPQPIADFNDHPYVRGEDIIRPKPRRLVDMRRAALGPDLTTQFSPPGGLSSNKMEGLHNPGGVLSSTPHAFAAQLPPILPAKPFGHGGGHFIPLNNNTESSNNNFHHILGKPLLTRPASTNSVGVMFSTKTNNNNNHAQQQRPQSQSPLYLPMGQTQYLNQTSPSLQKPAFGLKGFGLNQRSVPNLLQPLSNNNMYTPTPTPAHQQPARGVQEFNLNSPQRRLFLSPQPNETSPRGRISNSSSAFGGSSGNLLNEADNEDGNMPYYSELTLSPPKSSPGFMPVHMTGYAASQGQQGHNSLGIQPGQKPRIRIEWKSVDNLQKHNGPRLTTTQDIDINGPPQHVYNSPVHNNNNSVQNKGESFRISHPQPMASSTPLGFAFAHLEKKVERPEKSPEYDRIKSPSEIAQEMKERFANNSASVHYVEPDPPKNINLNTSKNNSSNKGVTEVNNTLNNQLGKSGTETTDFNSLGRSSTSDGDFGNLGDIISSEDANMYTADAGSTPSARNKSRHSAPSSKLKSRRKNILHNMSSEEMRLFNSGGGSGPQRFANSTNTGTGGSSSDGSSGHASMSDSQTSGSPPAEYASIPGAPPSLTSTNPVSPGGNVNVSGSGYKSVLKSVPEDETNGSHASGINSTMVTSSPGRLPHIGSDKGGSCDRKSTLDTSIGSGSKKSSRSSRHRNKEPMLLSNGNSGLEDIKQAIEQLTLRSSNGGGHHGVRETGHHSSYSTSTYSSMSGSECERHRRPHVIRYSSHDTINTQVTSADEFVWVDSHSRLVELQNIPWTNHDILKVVEKSSKLRDNLERLSMETVPRVSYLLQRALVRVTREIQRLGKPSGFCSKQEVASALKIVLSPALADSCSKACLRASAMFSVSTSDPLHRESKSSRAGGLNLHVGRFHRWMIDVRLGRFVHEFAAIYLTASMENLIEEILGQSLNNITINSDEGTNPILTAALLDKSLSNNGDLWGLLQPYAHLNAGRTASGALALPRRWASAASVDSSGSSSSTIGPSPHDDSSLSGRSHNHSKSLEQSLLTTCVGSIGELADILSLVSRVHYKQLPLSTTNNGSKVVPPSWSPSAVHTLFYFMRCSQLETSEEGLGGSSCNLGSSTATLGNESTHERLQHHGGQNARPPVQELVYERPFIVLPPLIEWVRVAAAHADHRHSGLVDKDDVMQAARMLLPGIDCPVRFVGCDEFSWPRRSLDEFECNKRLKIDLAFKMLTSGRSDLVAQALLLMPPSKANTFNEAGLSPLILASIRGEEAMVRVLLDAGAETDSETPIAGPNFPQANSETQHWTALTFSALMGHTGIVKVLLERNCSVEGGAKLSEEKSTQTPLQVASASGSIEMVSILLSYGANPFMPTLVRDSLCYTGSAQRGSFSALSVAAAHGQRAILHKLLSHPFNQPSSKEVLSLEEILAEGAAQPPGGRKDLLPGQLLDGRPVEEQKILSKTQVKVLQEAMYQSAENGHLNITLDLRNMGVPWTLHCWINSLSTSHELRCEPVIDQLLQDFLHILPHEDFSQIAFVEDCLPVLFTIFRQVIRQNEGSTLLLADIFQTCYGREPIKEVRDASISNGTRIDPKYVNNQELSDVQFRVEGRVFYSHKIVLVTSSQRFKSMLKSAPDSNPPVLQINDIRYPIFQMVMEYLYNGNSECIRHIEADDVLELMAAANFFQLDGLLRFCESRCSQTLNIESIVSMYIHAKVYNAVQLLEYCQGFLLQNMVALLTYDDSVRRLIFGKKLHNHDVLAGLLLTLQARLKSRPNATRKSK